MGKAQELTAREKSWHFFYLYDNPDFRKERFNVFRRLWQAPGDAFERALRPSCGLLGSFLIKWHIGKAAWLYVSGLAITYYIYYNSGDWTKRGSWKQWSGAKPPTMPYNPNYPKKDPHEYWDHGFKKGGTFLMPSVPVDLHKPAVIHQPILGERFHPGGSLRPSSKE